MKASREYVCLEREYCVYELSTLKTKIEYQCCFLWCRCEWCVQNLAWRSEIQIRVIHKHLTSHFLLPSFTRSSIKSRLVFARHLHNDKTRINDDFELLRLRALRRLCVCGRRCSVPFWCVSMQLWVEHFIDHFVLEEWLFSCIPSIVSLNICFYWIPKTYKVVLLYASSADLQWSSFQ